MGQITLLNETEAARFLDVQPKTLSAWRYRGTGPIFRKVGRLVKYLQTDLEEYLSKQARQSTSENHLDHSRNRKIINVGELT